MMRLRSRSAIRTRLLPAAGLVCHLITFGGTDETFAEGSRPRFTAWQEIVLLTVIKVRHAAANCGFRVDDGQLDAFLASAELGETAVDQQAFSPSLTRQIAADADLYLGAKDAACDQAWGRYGPDGAPGIRDTLKR